MRHTWKCHDLRIIFVGRWWKKVEVTCVSTCAARVECLCGCDCVCWCVWVCVPGGILGCCPSWGGPVAVNGGGRTWGRPPERIDHGLETKPRSGYTLGGRAKEKQLCKSLTAGTRGGWSDGWAPWVSWEFYFTPLSSANWRHPQPDCFPALWV